MTKLTLTFVAALVLSSVSAALAAPKVASKALEIVPPATTTNQGGQGPLGGPLWNFR